ncbi:50S ribosomal protein L22 [Helicovermis profundi]|uniref:Large ribosomal subunit protein uL22 n=1 Tax=Helicovermis profundi TaxID=3065157 RepID=A0AAU9EH50_9FIRM|nr:50S ribosomal protein L22 [Clostridia bacterium S502]
MQAKAVAKHVRISPRKVKAIANLVRGKSAKEARAILQFTPRKGARLMLKVLDSAVANAENNHNMNVEDLYISEVYANQGPTMKRFTAGSMGRANPMLRRTSHIGVAVSERK